MDVYQKFGTRSLQYQRNQELVARLFDSSDTEIGLAFCQVCEATFGHTGRLRHIFTCNECYESVESERFFIGRVRKGY
jgi:protein-arginine kinase activator protein McsA